MLFTGHSGVGKSVVIADTMNKLVETGSWARIDMSFSAQTSAQRSQETIESKLEKKAQDKKKKKVAHSLALELKKEAAAVGTPPPSAAEAPEAPLKAAAPQGDEADPLQQFQQRVQKVLANKHMSDAEKVLVVQKLTAKESSKASGWQKLTTKAASG